MPTRMEAQCSRRGVPDTTCDPGSVCPLRMSAICVEPTDMDLAEAPSQPFRRHPWEEARFRFLYDVLHAAGLDRRAARVLDVGAGDAWFASQLAQRMPAGSEITCWDTGYTPGGPAGARD